MARLVDSGKYPTRHGTSRGRTAYPSYDEGGGRNITEDTAESRKKELHRMLFFHDSRFVAIAEAASVHALHP